MWGFGQITGPEAKAKAREAAEKALALDPFLSDAHLYMGLYKNYFEYDWTGAEAEYKKAIALDPGHMPAHHEYSYFLTLIGRYDEALTEARLAQALDPVSPLGYESMGHAYIRSGRYAEAIEPFEKAIDLEPDCRGFPTSLAKAKFYIMLEQGRYKELLAEYEHAESWGDRQRLMLIYKAMGRQEEARALFDSLKLELERPKAYCYGIARLHRDMGDMAGALDWLEKAYDERENYPWSIYFDIQSHLWNPLRSEPRFQALLKKMGLEP